MFRRPAPWMVVLVVAVPLVLGVWTALGARSMAAQARSKVERTLTRYGLRATLPEDIAWSWSGVVSMGPVALHNLSAPGSAAPMAEVERVTLHPRWSAILRGKLELDRVVLQNVDAQLLPWIRWARARMDRPESEKKASASSSSDVSDRVGRLEWEGLLVHVQRGERQVHTEPFTGWLVPGKSEAGRTTAEAEVSLARGGSVRIHLDVTPEGSRAVEAEFTDFPVLPGWALQIIGLRPELLEGKLNGKVSVSRPEPSVLRAQVALRSTEVFVTDARLGPRVGPMEMAAEGTAEWKTKAATASFDLKLGPKNFPLHTDVKLSREGDKPFGVRVTLPASDFGDLVSAMPASLAPPAPVYGLKGPLSGWLSLNGALTNRETWELDARFDTEAFQQDVGTLNPLGLQNEFAFTVRQGSGKGRSLRVGPSNGLYVPFDAVPHLLVTGLLLSEDSGFYAHQGFDLRALSRHLFRPETDKGVLRGGSTLSQQLAKNLFLSPERTFARKIREAFSTLALEAAVPKRRLLEIYLNIIEWGPGLYGIGEAAEHYFGKRPSMLTLKEMIFLATIVPSPVKYHGYCSRGAVTPIWENRMSALLIKMYDAGVISAEELNQAESETLTFHHGRVPVEPAGQYPSSGEDASSDEDGADEPLP